MGCVWGAGALALVEHWASSLPVVLIGAAVARSVGWSDAWRRPAAFC